MKKALNRVLFYWKGESMNGYKKYEQEEWWKMKHLERQRNIAGAIMCLAVWYTIGK